jgi:glutathione S-transferase
VQRIVVPHLENEVEATTFRLTDPKFFDTVTDDRERMFLLRIKERKFGRGCLDAWRQQAPQLHAQAEALLEPFDLMLRHSRISSEARRSTRTSPFTGSSATSRSAG